MKRIVIAGGTGFIGSHLARALVARGDQVTVLTRRAGSKAADSGAALGLPDGVELCGWAPAEDGDWQRVLDGKDGVVQLAGETLVGRRPTASLKQEFYDSRVTSTECIVRGIERAESKPKVFVCGSAVGYYGADRGVETLDEQSSPGLDFFASLCLAWEASANRASNSGVRVVNARIGIVLGPDGGALPKMAFPFKFFVGGPIGSGEQMVSWVHIDDCVGMLLKCLDDESVSGPANLTAPRPASNRELSVAIGEGLGRPAWFRVPAWVLKLMFGEGAEPILGGQSALPNAMLGRGYEFRYEGVAQAVKAALKNRSSSPQDE